MLTYYIEVIINKDKKETKEIGNRYDSMGNVFEHHHQPSREMVNRIEAKRDNGDGNGHGNEKRLWIMNTASTIASVAQSPFA